jgi:transposase
MNVQQIIGADVSKTSIDLASYQCQTHLKIDNTADGFKRFEKWLTQHKINPAQTLVVMEHTGLYSYWFEHFLQKQNISFTKVPALAITKSLGMIRGKTDKIDAARIALYGFEKQHLLSPTLPQNPQLLRLQMLHSTRHHLVKQKAAMLCAVEEYEFVGIRKTDPIIKSQLAVINTIDKQIDELNQEMETLINQDEGLRKNYKLLISIKGVGKVVATAMIIKTSNFTRFRKAKKFACFCGIAPFEHTSGTSIRGKTRVSHLADKEMKSLLHLSAQTAVKNDKELRRFYLRKTENGKPKMSTLNIVCNKIVSRMFAVIKRQTPYIEYNLQAA